MRKGKFYTVDDYIITENGEVINKHNNRTVKPQKNNKGYLRVSIGKKLVFVHRLVAQQYIPNPHNLPQVNHKDGNKINNNYKNLEWVSNQGNRTHAVENGLHLSGEQCPWHKLKDKDVEYIRQCNNMTVNELAKKFNVTSGYIRELKAYINRKQMKRYAEL